MKFTFRCALCALSLITVSGAANAGPLALESRLGGQAVYDPNSGLTWLADANYAKTSGYDTDGKMTWSEANSWADSLTIGGFSDWRLPDADPNCGVEYNCTLSEMGSLYYTALAGTQGNPPNFGAEGFSDSVQLSVYWSATELPNNPNAWSFGMGSGYQLTHNKANSYYAWAVRSGDVSAVPEPTALSLIGIGAVGLFAARSRRARATQRTYG